MSKWFMRTFYGVVVAYIVFIFVVALANTICDCLS